MFASVSLEAWWWTKNSPLARPTSASCARLARRTSSVATVAVALAPAWGFSTSRPDLGKQTQGRRKMNLCTWKDFWSLPKKSQVAWLPFQRPLRELPAPAPKSGEKARTLIPKLKRTFEGELVLLVVSPPKKGRKTPCFQLPSQGTPALVLPRAWPKGAAAGRHARSDFFGDWSQNGQSNWHIFLPLTS